MSYYKQNTDKYIFNKVYNYFKISLYLSHWGWEKIPPFRRRHSQCIILNGKIWTLLKVLLQWNSTSVYTSWTYSTYHLELALSTFTRHFISAYLVCHTSKEKISLNSFWWQGSNRNNYLNLKKIIIQGYNMTTLRRFLDLSWIIYHAPACRYWTKRQQTDSSRDRPIHSVAPGCFLNVTVWF